MSQKTALVTGANDGIGFEVAKQLAQKGYSVILCARSHEKGKAAVEKILAEVPSSSVTFVPLEINNAMSVAAAAKRVEQHLGQKPLDVLVNNAGIGHMDKFPKQRASVVDLDLVRDCFETNFFGTIEVTKAFVPLLIKADVPVIVNVSTDMASTGNQARPEAGMHVVAYNTSKAALNSFTVALAHDLKNAKVNAVTPGYTSTKLNGFSGPKSTADGAALIVKYATLDKDGPTCKFFNENGELPW